ncbi:MAG: MFS transporter [Pseudomonadales bacterium]|nr:MFS transporter [Pseudomonadales bacterium]
MASRDVQQVLLVRNFVWLWIGSLGSSFAMNMQIIARGWLVYTLTSSAIDLAWVTMSFMLPTVLFSLYGGVLADRLQKKKVIVWAQALNCLATLIMAVIIFSEQVAFWDFIYFGFFNGTILALSMPARQAFVPELIEEKLVFAAMGLNTAGWNLARIIGPAFAGLLIALIAEGDKTSHYGVGIVYVVIAALYFISAATMLLIDKSGRVKRDSKGSAWEDMREGVTYVLANPPVFGLIVLSIIPFLFGMPLNTLLPAFNEEILGGHADDLGFLVSSMGVGAIIGSFMMATMGDLKRKGAWLIITCVGWGAVTSAFGMSESYVLAVAMIAAVGWFSSWNMSMNRGMMQMQVDNHMRGRVMSIDMMSHGLMPLGVFPISWIAENYDVGTALVVSGSIFIALTLLSVWFIPSVRTTDRGRMVDGA